MIVYCLNKRSAVQRSQEPCESQSGSGVKTSGGKNSKEQGWGGREAWDDSRDPGHKPGRLLPEVPMAQSVAGSTGLGVAGWPRTTVSCWCCRVGADSTGSVLNGNQPRSQSPLRTWPGSQVPAREGLIAHTKRVRWRPPASPRISAMGLNFKEKCDGVDM